MRTKSSPEPKREVCHPVRWRRPHSKGRLPFESTPEATYGIDKEIEPVCQMPPLCFSISTHLSAVRMQLNLEGLSLFGFQLNRRHCRRLLITCKTNLLGETLRCRRFEQCSQCEHDSKTLADPRENHRTQERMAAQFKKIVCRPNVLVSQEIGPYLDNSVDLRTAFG
jgi:hypothetical protein